MPNAIELPSMDWRLLQAGGRYRNGRGRQAPEPKATMQIRPEADTSIDDHRCEVASPTGLEGPYGNLDRRLKPPEGLCRPLTRKPSD